jgi:hypothetical protein
MDRGDIQKAAALFDQIESLERCLRAVKVVKDLTLNTAGHTLMQLKAEERGSLFPELVTVVCREIERKIGVARAQLTALGVD